MQIEGNKVDVTIRGSDLGDNGGDGVVRGIHFNYD